MPDPAPDVAPARGMPVWSGAASACQARKPTAASAVPVSAVTMVPELTLAMTKR